MGKPPRERGGLLITLKEFQNNELTDELVVLKKLCEELKEEI